MSTAEEIRARTRSTYTARSGLTYTLAKPGPSTMLRAGFNVLLLQGVGNAAELQKKAAEMLASFTVDAALAMQEKLLAACCIEPRVFIGHAADCPDGFVLMSDIEQDVPELVAELLRLANIIGAEAAATAAATFRGDTAGAGGESSVQAVPDEAVGVPG